MEARLVRKHFVLFMYSASFFSRRSAQEVAERDPAKIEVPATAFAFSFFDRIVGVVVESGKEIPVSSDALDTSPTYYYGGKVYTIDELKREFPNELMVISRVGGNGYKQAIRCRTGNWQPFKDTDIYIEERVA